MSIEKSSVATIKQLLGTELNSLHNLYQTLSYFHYACERFRDFSDVLLTRKLNVARIHMLAMERPPGQDVAPPHAHEDQPTTSQQHRSASENLADQVTLPNHGIEINVPLQATNGRPLLVKHMSAPAYQSPIRHHRRVPSRTSAVKETLNARSYHASGDDEGGPSMHRINQYMVKQEIGRGSFGAVHLAVDQYGKEFAVKEFSKSRLRKRAQSNLLRQSHHKRAGGGFNSPLHRILPYDKSASHSTRPFDLIKEEIAIMKKLNHHNVVNLVEVLDDPQEDTLYMVLEMCKKGIVMQVGLDDRAEPYSDEACRCWFRDMILGIEYLHAQGIIHRDIKPDNCLVTDEDVLKIVDFGVSEMFEKASDMNTTKSAGSPAFMPPELCVAKHGAISGRAADIWSMGVTLYCLRYGHIPFEKSGMLELYEAIRSDPVPLAEENDARFKDLMSRLLDKDPETRISMSDLREHPWVTKNGTDPLLSEDENCSEIVEPPTEAEMERAITGNMANLMVVMKAVKRFKGLLMRKRPLLMSSILGSESRLVTPPNSMQRPQPEGARSFNASDRKPVETVLAAEGIHRDIEVNNHLQKLPVSMDRLSIVPQEVLDRHSELARQATDRSATIDDRSVDGKFDPLPQKPLSTRAATFPRDDHAKGHAHDPLEDTLYLNIGAGTADDIPNQDDDLQLTVSESPGGVEENIYEKAYQDEMDRIMSQRGKDAAMYLTRRVEHRDDLRAHSNIIDRSKAAAKTGARHLSNNISTSVNNMPAFTDVVKQVNSQIKPTAADVVRQVNAQIKPTAEQKAKEVGLKLYEST